MLKSLISISFLLFLIGSPQSLRAQDQEAKVEISSKPNKVSAGDQRKFDYFFYEGLNLKAAGKFDAAYDAFNHCLAIDSTASLSYMNFFVLCPAEPSGKVAGDVAACGGLQFR